MLGSWSSRMMTADAGDVEGEAGDDRCGDTHSSPASTPPDTLIGEVKFSFRRDPTVSQRDRTLLKAPVKVGIPGMRSNTDPGDGYTISELARYLRITPKEVATTAKRLGLLKKLPRDRRHRPLTRYQVKVLLRHYRAR